MSHFFISDFYSYLLSSQNGRSVVPGRSMLPVPYPPPPPLAVKFMELERSWWLCRWRMKYRGISFALQQLHHRVTALGAIKLYLTWILVRVLLGKGLRTIDMIYHKRGLFFFFLLVLFYGVCVYVYFLNHSSGHFFSQMKRKEPGKKQELLK